jgi:hypothetical protein
VAQGCAARYRARNPRATPLYRLFETHFDEVRGQLEERFERRCGFWRGFVDEQVRRYLDCGLFENGFARIRCPECSEEYLLAFSCKTRELCPSCAAKRSAATAALLADEVFEEVGHAQWVFVMPKMLRPYFLHHRELLGGLAHAAWETVLERMCAAAGDEGMRPGMVAVVQTAGDLANWHPHVHAIVSRGGSTQDGEWIPVAFVDEHSAELLYRHKVTRLLQDEGLLTDERIELLLSRRHTGISVHNRVRVEPEDQLGVERLARSIMRPPISLERRSSLWQRKLLFVCCDDPPARPTRRRNSFDELPRTRTCRGASAGRLRLRMGRLWVRAPARPPVRLVSRPATPAPSGEAGRS